MSLLYVSWKNLLNKPLNLGLSVVLFSLGVGLIALLMQLNHQLQEKFDRNLAGIDLVIGAKGSPLQLILSAMFHIDNPTGNIALEDARPFLNPKHPLIAEAYPISLGDSYRAYRIVGTERQFAELYGGELEQGRYWERPMEVVLGAEVAHKLGLGLDSRFQSAHGLQDDENLVHEDAEAFRVVGILKPTGSVLDQLILTPTQSIWHVHESHAAEEEHHTHEHSLPADERTALLEAEGQAITAILLKFRGRNYQALNMQRQINENTTLMAATPALELNRLYNMMGVGQDALEVLAYVIMAVSAFSVFISLFSSLNERKYELALMRVMGGRPGTLFLLITLEGLLLASMGCVAGLLLGHGALAVLAERLEKAYRYAFEAWSFLPAEGLLVLAALGIGLLAALIPAWQAGKTDISRTLAKG